MITAGFELFEVEFIKRLAVVLGFVKSAIVKVVVIGIIKAEFEVFVKVKLKFRVKAELIRMAMFKFRGWKVYM